MEQQQGDPAPAPGPQEAPAPPQRLPNGRFPPGVSGSPERVWKPGQSGNPKGPEPSEVKRLREKARAEITANAELGVSILLDVMINPRTKARDKIECAKFFVEQDLGRAKVRTEISGPDGGRIPLGKADPKEMTTEEREREIAALLAAAAADSIQESDPHDDDEPGAPRA